MECPSCYAKVKLFAYYLQQLVRERLHPTTTPSPPPPGLSLKLQSEAHQIAEVVCKALKHQLQLEWSLNLYQENLHRSKAKLRSLCPPLGPLKPDGLHTLRDEPFLVMDAFGRIVMWYLPSVICKERQAAIHEAISWLSNVPASSPLIQKPDGNFRVNPERFSPSTPDLRSGVVTYASAWPMAGHPKGPWAPSANFKNDNEGGLEFLERISDSLAVVGAILAVIHPTLFEAGMDVLSNIHSSIIEVKDYPLFEKVFRHWATPFTAFSIVTNRETEFHRDSLSPINIFDLLYTAGDYDDGRLDVPGIGIRCRYNPGTVVALLTATFEHGVPQVNGPRICIAHFFRRVMLLQNPYQNPPKLPTIDGLLNHFKTYVKP